MGTWLNMLTMGVSDFTIKSLRKAPGMVSFRVC